ncbi:MAG TPA: alpha/beta hydrolase [Actinomycetota bacterium]|nr:alpha/beta hydrolase [Actinomycetota bacterium]
MKSRQQMVRVPTSHGEMALHISGTGSPVCFVHGIPGSAKSFERVAARLEAGHTVVRADLLGFGASDRPSASASLLMSGQARALAEALDAVAVRRCAFVGHDYGAVVILSLLAHDPARATRFAIAATNVFPDTPIPFPLSLVVHPALGSIAERAVFSTVSLSLMLRMASGRGATPDRAAALGDAGQRRAIRMIFAEALRGLPTLYPPVRDALSRVAVPSLVVWGDKDPFFDVEQGRRTADVLPHSRFVVYDGAGHFIPEERPDLLAADLLTLLAETE